MNNWHTCRHGRFACLRQEPCLDYNVWNIGESSVWRGKGWQNERSGQVMLLPGTGQACFRTPAPRTSKEANHPPALHTHPSCGRAPHPQVTYVECGALRSQPARTTPAVDGGAARIGSPAARTLPTP